MYYLSAKKCGKKAVNQMNESIMVALQVYGLGFVISLVIAVLIKGISLVFDRLSGENKVK